MKAINEFLRVVFISPEMLVGILPYAISFYWEEPATFAAQLFVTDNKWVFATAATPLALLAATYSFGSEILSPAGAKKELLVWPDYWKLKMRVIVALGFCLFGCILALGGAYMVQHEKIIWGATTVVSGLLTAAAALASVALAKWNIREILPD